VLLRRRVLVALLAFAISFISSMETSYAQPAMAISVELPSPELRAGVVGVEDPSLPTLLEMSDRSTVMAMDMLMVSMVVEKVELARQPDGAREIAKEIATETYGWSDKQFTCLNTLWTRESHWNYRARNPRTGAHGIAQALPATKMEVIGTDWRTNPITQIQWGLRYISIRYDNPCKALAKFKRSRYY
jgi:Transglycosylase SLT domain